MKINLKDEESRFLKCRVSSPRYEDCVPCEHHLKCFKTMEKIKSQLDNYWFNKLKNPLNKENKK